MILVFLSNENQCFIWNADDWLELRQKHRIVTHLIGSLTSFPRQEIINGLPACLLPEEVTLLKEIGIIRVVCCPTLSACPSREFNYYLNVHKDDINIIEEPRAVHVDPPSNSSLCDADVQNAFTETIEKVIPCEGNLNRSKRRKYADMPVVPTSENTNSDSSVQCYKSSQVNVSESNIELKSEDHEKRELQSYDQNYDKSNCSQSYLVHIPTGDLWLNDEDLEDVKWSYPENDIDNIKYSTFKDLWNRGYYLTDGSKFSGDFVVYPGDPSIYHSIFIVTCLREEDPINVKRVITQGRIGTASIKTVVLATKQLKAVDVDSEKAKIRYNSIHWDEQVNISQDV